MDGLPELSRAQTALARKKSLGSRQRPISQADTDVSLWDQGQVQDLRRKLNDSSKTISELNRRIDILSKERSESSDLEFYEDLLQRMECRLKQTTNLLRSANLHQTISQVRQSKAMTGSVVPANAFAVQKLLNELTDSLDKSSEIEVACARKSKELHEITKGLAMQKKENETIKIENDQLKSELKQMHALLNANIKSSAIELTLRKSEKFKSDRLSKEVDTLHRCTAYLLEHIQEGSPIPQDTDDAYGEVGMRKTVAELMRQNQLLYRKCVFATKQQILAELRLKANTTLNSPAVIAQNNGANASRVPQVLSLPEYIPLVNGSSQAQRDFLTFLSASRGYFSEVFLKEISAEVADNCVGFLCREFAAFVDWDQRLRQLMEDIEKINAIRDTDHAVTVITDTICRMTGSDRASIWMTDEISGEAWTRKYSETSENSRVQEFRIPLGRGLVGAAYTTKLSVNIPDAYQDGRFDRSVDLKTGYRTKSVICFPIVKSSKVISVIQAINKQNGEMFTVQDEFIIRVFGTAASQTIVNCESQAVADWFDYRRDLLVEAARSLADKCNTPADLLRVAQKTMSRLFRVHEVCITMVSHDKCMRLYLDEDNGLVNVVEVPHGIGMIGVSVEIRHPTSVLCDDTRINRLVDLVASGSGGAKTSDDRSSSSSSTSTSTTALHTFPVMEGTRIRTVLQFSCPATRGLISVGPSLMARPTSNQGLVRVTSSSSASASPSVANLPSFSSQQPTVSGPASILNNFSFATPLAFVSADNGAFNEQNPKQVDVLSQLANLLLPYFCKFYPSTDSKKNVGKFRAKIVLNQQQ